MALNYVWLALFGIGMLVGVLRLIFEGDTETLPAMMDSTFEMSMTAFELTIGLTGTLTLWMGILKVGEDSGLVARLSRLLSPVLTKLFPEIPKNHPALGSIFMNISANMLGLDNAATPVGLKAMQELQSINKQYYDAAKVDGSSKSRIFWRITVPLLGPMLAYVIITGFIGGFKEYTSIVGIFGASMGPAHDAKRLNTMVGFIYDALASNQQGRASAAAIILFGIILVVTLINLRVSNKKVHY